MLGGNNNQTDKQIRFEMYNGKISSTFDQMIMEVYASLNEGNRWDVTELLDLKDAFVKVLNKKFHEKCCNGIIAIL